MTTSRYRAELVKAYAGAGRRKGAKLPPARVQEAERLLDDLTAGVHPALFVTVFPALGFANEQAAFGYGLDIAFERIGRVTRALPRPSVLDDAGGGAF